MANDSANRHMRKLQAENKRLVAEVESLRSQLASQAVASEAPGAPPAAASSAPAHKKHLIRKTAVVASMVLAVLLLIAGNIFFWAGGTIVQTDRYVASTAPLIKNAQIQDALATKITNALFSSVDVDQAVAESLPPRADFLAPTLSNQVKQSADDAVKKVLQRPQFQERWNIAQQRAHDRLIQSVGRNGSDGSIDISEVYSSASQQLKDTKLAFLADKPLPAKVGNIQLVSGTWVSVLNTTIRNIDTWRVVTLLLLFVFGFLAVWLSDNRRRTAIVLGCLLAGSMFLTLVAGRLFREVLAGRADPQYAEAVRQAYTIIAHPLVVQTWLVFAVALLMTMLAWISGPYRSSQTVKAKTTQLFTGRIHYALFSQENTLTRWIGAHKALLQWLVVAAVAISWLFVRLTLTVLVAELGALLLLVIIIEVLAAKPARVVQLSDSDKKR